MTSDEWLTLTHISMQGKKPTEGDPQVVIVAWLAECEKSPQRHRLYSHLFMHLSTHRHSQIASLLSSLLSVIEAVLCFSGDAAPAEIGFSLQMLTAHFGDVSSPMRGERGGLPLCSTMEKGVSSSVRGTTTFRAAGFILRESAEERNHPTVSGIKGIDRFLK